MKTKWKKNEKNWNLANQKSKNSTNLKIVKGMLKTIKKTRQKKTFENWKCQKKEM